VRRYLKVLVPLFGLEGWELDHRFVNDQVSEPFASGRPASATTDALWQYSTAIIRWSLPVLATSLDDRVRAIVAHELAHCLVAEMTLVVDVDPERGHEEHLTEAFARTVLRAGGWPTGAWSER